MATMARRGVRSAGERRARRSQVGNLALGSGNILDGGGMNDTSPEMEECYRAMIMERSGEERLKMGCSMFDTAKALMRAGILDQNPHASPAKIRRALFMQLYGHKFDADSRRKILAAIEATTHPVAK